MSAPRQPHEPGDERRDERRDEQEALRQELERRLAQGQLVQDGFWREEARHRQRQITLVGGSLTLLGVGLEAFGLYGEPTRWAIAAGAWALTGACGVTLWWMRCPRCGKLPLSAGTLVHQRRLGLPTGCARCGLQFVEPAQAAPEGSSPARDPEGLERDARDARDARGGP